MYAEEVGTADSENELDPQYELLGTGGYDGAADDE
jgi:hypothetical protein